ncbi:lytic transglycosylase domain-containing protein [Crocinitomix algicola]|uniref:lytic transglycosylase domain-containing protein n=1 Tax=Crocinitomix algicola TaxID=1740263 RepID=UPI000832F94D|nr:lytic transglycosylase domain-containing protein [Crocinitomix algicola]
MRLLTLLLSFLSIQIFAQDSTTVVPDSIHIELTEEEEELTYQRFLNVVEHSLFEYYKETWGQERAYAVIDSLGYEENDRPEFSDSIFYARLNALNENTIIEIEANEDVLKTVKYFAKNRRRFTAVCIGRSKLYFPMYEEYLDKHQIPLELKYLSVIESGLRPQVKSRVGATGLWQFMYRTGRMYGLDNDSYVDERMDPEKATEAACAYLKYLNGLYGDWSIALAAYNAGPGNVNKAIRRSGGQMNYWKLRPYLPKETQMYVPNFIAMLYMMTHYADHNIIPKEAQVYLHEVDTVCLSSSIRINHLDSLIGFSSDDFQYLNPVYKTEVVPKTNPKQCINLPVEKIDTFLLVEQQLYDYDLYLDSIGQNFVTLEKKKTHYVKTDETLVQIAAKYNVDTRDIRNWNGLRSNKIYPGQKLTLKLIEYKFIEDAEEIEKVNPSKTTKSSSPPKTSDDGKYQYYTLRSGESLWTVSQKFGIPFDQIQALNRNIDPKRMQPGDLIRIKRL